MAGRDGDYSHYLDKEQGERPAAPVVELLLPESTAPCPVGCGRRCPSLELAACALRPTSAAPTATPIHPGTMTRTGVPWSDSNGPSFIPSGRATSEHCSGQVRGELHDCAGPTGTVAATEQPGRFTGRTEYRCPSGLITVSRRATSRANWAGCASNLACWPTSRRIIHAGRRPRNGSRLILIILAGSVVVSEKCRGHRPRGAVPTREVRAR